MAITHIRVGVRRAGKRINDSRGNPGQTVCGAELTSYDVTLTEARKLTRDQILDPRFPVCQMCLAKMPAETSGRTMQELADRTTAEGRKAVRQ
jgi:hypothetical protein